MIRSLLKAVAYKTAPRTTFVLSHPKQTARLAKFRWDIKHALAPRVAAVGAGVGVAALALPIGLMIGRMRRARTPDAH